MQKKIISYPHHELAMHYTFQEMLQLSLSDLAKIAYYKFIRGNSAEKTYLLKRFGDIDWQKLTSATKKEYQGLFRRITYNAPCKGLATLHELRLSDKRTRNFLSFNIDGYFFEIDFKGACCFQSKILELTKVIDEIKGKDLESFLRNFMDKRKMIMGLKPFLKTLFKILQAFVEFSGEK
ncbi:hypothetical protein ACFL5G_02750 [Candidatus Margulisiibacteriota bacterium]